MRRTVPLLVACVLLPACGPTQPSTPNTKGQTLPTKDDHEKYPPCHPGCVPSGTLGTTPSGLREIQTIDRGETVTIITADGTASTGRVEEVFKTCNKLLNLWTDAGPLRTTETQPLCLTGGGFTEAGTLKAGDRIWKWADGKRTEVTVKEVTPVEGTAAVFNLVVGTDKVFVANGFLARGKPPATP